MSGKFVDLDEMNELRAAATRGTWTEEPVIRCEHVEVHAAEANRTVAMWLDASNAKLIVSLVNAWPQIEAELRQLRHVAAVAKRHRAEVRHQQDGFQTGMMLDLELSALSRMGDDE